MLPAKAAKTPLFTKPLPQKLTLNAPLHKIEAKQTGKPRKASPWISVFSCLRSPRGFLATQHGCKPGAATIPNRLTLAPNGQKAVPTVCRALPDDPVLQNLTFYSIAINARLPNPLTICPGATHRCPRTPSLQIPARPHQASRKASPSRPQTPAGQGFAMALTFLTWVQRCLYLYLSRPRPASPSDKPHPNRKL